MFIRICALKTFVLQHEASDQLTEETSVSVAVKQQTMQPELHRSRISLSPSEDSDLNFCKDVTDTNAPFPETF